MKKYLITDPKQFHNFAYHLKKHNPDFACFRDKEMILQEKDMKMFMNIGRETKTVLIIHTHLELAIKYKADGVHFSSLDFKKIVEAKRANMYVIASTHNIDEAKMAVDLKADAITFSPIFATPNKGEPVGLEKLKEIVDIIDIPIFALGGIISQEQITALEAIKPYGFASIRYFTQ